MHQHHDTNPAPILFLKIKFAASSKVYRIQKAYFMLMAFSGEAQNCKLYVSKNKTKLPEIIFNRASLYEREQKE